MLNVRLATSEMKLSSVVAETSDEGPVGMSVLKTPVDIFARKLREHNIKINIITVFIILFLFLFIIVVFLTFSKNFDLQNEIDTMKKEINALKILYRNNQAEISAIELSEVRTFHYFFLFPKYSKLISLSTDTSRKYFWVLQNLSI